MGYDFQALPPHFSVQLSVVLSCGLANPGSASSLFSLAKVQISSASTDDCPLSAPQAPRTPPQITRTPQRWPEALCRHLVVSSGDTPCPYSGGEKMFILLRNIGDCSHEIKRRLLLGRKLMTNGDSIFKSRDITLPAKVHVSQGYGFSGGHVWM